MIDENSDINAQLTMNINVYSEYEKLVLSNLYIY